jgi:peptidyl-dipeptidase Dcp
MKLNSRKPESSKLKEGETPTLDIAEPNPLLAQWGGPYGDVPPFDKVQVTLFKPALEAAMSENLADVDKIANDPAAPTFENLR